MSGKRLWRAVASGARHRFGSGRGRRSRTSQVPESAVAACTYPTSPRGFTTVHTFLDADGADPTPLVLAGSTLFGTAAAGGTSPFNSFGGTVFVLETNGGGFAPLREFVSGSGDGESAQSGLVLSGSTLYGVTYSGGDFSGYDGQQLAGWGNLFQVKTDGSDFAVLKGFTGGSDGGRPWAWSAVRRCMERPVAGAAAGPGCSSVFEPAQWSLHHFEQPDSRGWQLTLAHRKGPFARFDDRLPMVFQRYQRPQQGDEPGPAMRTTPPLQAGFGRIRSESAILFVQNRTFISIIFSPYLASFVAMSPLLL